MLNFPWFCYRRHLNAQRQIELKWFDKYLKSSEKCIAHEGDGEWERWTRGSISGRRLILTYITSCHHHSTENWPGVNFSWSKKACGGRESRKWLLEWKLFRSQSILLHCCENWTKWFRLQWDVTANESTKALASTYVPCSRQCQSQTRHYQLSLENYHVSWNTWQGPSRELHFQPFSSRNDNPQAIGTEW